MGRKAAWNKVIAYADLETDHELDLNAKGIYPYIKGNTVVYLAADGSERIPEVGIKCAGIIITFPDARPDKEIVVDTIPELLEVLGRNKVDRCYFHNLKFDDAFIASYMTDGWVQCGDYAVISESRTINDRGVVYADNLFFKNTKAGKRCNFTHKCVLWDSSKIWAMPLRKLGEDFGVFKSGSGNEEALRVGCDDRMREYCLQDCRVVKAAMEYYFKQCNIASNGARPFGWMTAAATSYNLCMMAIRDRIGQGGVMARYPDATPDNGMPAWIRESYKGAVPLLDPAIKGIELRDVSVYDVNSQYPDKLRNYPLPYGPGIPLGTCDMDRLMRIKSRGKLWIAKVRMVANVKPGHRATYMLKHRGDDGNTLADHINDLVGLNSCDHQVITSADMDYIMRDYDIEHIDVIEAIGFEPDIDRIDPVYKIPIEGHALRPFIDHWYEIKDKAGRDKDKSLKGFAKLILNSLYGKFGANPEHTSAHYNFIDGNMIRLEVDPETEVDDHPYYLPIAIFTTAYARDVISKTCGAVGWDHVAYTDTDSIHVHGLDRATTEARIRSAGYEIDGDILGAYDYESRWDQALYVRNKGYFHYTELDRDSGQPIGGNEIKMAGVNDTGGFKELADVIDQKLIGIQRRAYRVKGGILLMDKDVEIDTTVDRIKTIQRIKGYSKDASKAMIEEMEGKLWDLIQ